MFYPIFFTYCSPNKYNILHIHSLNYGGCFDNSLTRWVAKNYSEAFREEENLHALWFNRIISIIIVGSLTLFIEHVVILLFFFFPSLFISLHFILFSFLGEEKRIYGRMKNDYHAKQEQREREKSAEGMKRCFRWTIKRERERELKIWFICASREWILLTLSLFYCLFIYVKEHERR